MASRSSSPTPDYRGRLAPSPTGYLHLGHARTFWTAFERARAAGGTLAMRIEDLDPDRSRAEYAEAAIEDLHWLGIDWQEGPGSSISGLLNPSQGGPFALTSRASAGRSILTHGASCCGVDFSFPAAVRARIWKPRSPRRTKVLLLVHTGRGAIFYPTLATFYKTQILRLRYASLRTPQGWGTQAARSCCRWTTNPFTPELAGRPLYP